MWVLLLCFISFPDLPLHISWVLSCSTKHAGWQCKYIFYSPVNSFWKKINRKAVLYGLIPFYFELLYRKSSKFCILLRPVTWHCHWCKLAFLDKRDSNSIQPWEVGMVLCGESEVLKKSEAEKKSVSEQWCTKWCKVSFMLFLCALEEFKTERHNNNKTLLFSLFLVSYFPAALGFWDLWALVFTVNFTLESNPCYSSQGLRKSLLGMKLKY